MCWPLSDGSSKLVPIDEEPNHQSMQALRLGETDGAAYQPFDPRPYIHGLAFDCLGVCLPNCGLLRLYMTFVGPPTVGGIACDAQRCSQRFQLQKDRVFPSSEHSGPPLPRVVLNRVPPPPRLRFAGDIPPHCVQL